MNTGFDEPMDVPGAETALLQLLANGVTHNGLTLWVSP